MLDADFISERAMLRFQPNEKDKIAPALAMIDQMGQLLPASIHTPEQFSFFLLLREDISSPSLPVQDLMRNVPVVSENLIVTSGALSAKEEEP